jgi:hypothetical protein
MEMDWVSGAYWWTGAEEMDGVTGCIYSGDHKVYISYHLISFITELHTPCFESFHLSCTVGHFVDPHNRMDSHSQVVVYLLNPFLQTSSHSCSFSQIPVGLLREVQWRVDDGLSVR